MAFYKFTNGTLADANEVNANNNFISTQAVINRLNGEIVGSPMSDRITGDGFAYDLFKTDTATYAKFLRHDGSNNYVCMDTSNTGSSTAFVWIEAGSVVTTGWTYSTVKQVASGSYIAYVTGGTYEVNRAKLMYDLFYGDAAGKAKTHIYLPTALKTTDTRDIGKRGIYIYVMNDAENTFPSDYGAEVYGSFTSTTGNGSVSSWSKMYSGRGASYGYWKLNGATLNSVTSGSSDEFLTNTSADVSNNPGTWSIASEGENGATATAEAFMLSAHGITVLGSNVIFSSGNSPYGTTSYTTYDYYATGGVPLTTQLSASDALTCVLTSSMQSLGSTYAKGFVKGQYTAAGNNTVTFEVSYNNGTTYTALTEKEWGTISTSGSQAVVRMTVTRQTGSDATSIGGYGLLYS